MDLLKIRQLSRDALDASTDGVEIPISSAGFVEIADALKDAADEIERLTTALDIECKAYDEKHAKYVRARAELEAEIATLRSLVPTLRDGEKKFTGEANLAPREVTILEVHEVGGGRITASNSLLPPRYYSLPASDEVARAAGARLYIPGAVRVTVEFMPEVTPCE